MAISAASYFVLYLPVIHDGYLRAFDRYSECTIGVLDTSVSYLPDYLRKDIRRLDPKSAADALKGLGYKAEVISEEKLACIFEGEVVLPNDDVSEELIRAFPGATTIVEPVFLRWDRNNSTEARMVEPDSVIPLDDCKPIVDLLRAEEAKSTNWWRHVGAVLVDKNNGIICYSHNSSLPTPYSSSVDSDPRITSKRGQSIETSIDIHAEAALIASAAKQGISTDGSSIFVSMFPCPNCAKIIANSGIHTVYFIEGYAMVDGLDIMKSSDIKIVRVDTPAASELPASLKQYPTS